MEKPPTPDVKIKSIKEDPRYTDSAEIEKSRQELLSLDIEGKILLAPNQRYKGELDMWRTQLFEPREELNGKSPYNYFNRIIIGHGEGPADINQREFKGSKNLDPRFQGKIGEILSRSSNLYEKILVIVCGTEEADKMTLSSAIEKYLAQAK